MEKLKGLRRRNIKFTMKKVSIWKIHENNKRREALILQLSKCKAENKTHVSLSEISIKSSTFKSAFHLALESL